LLTVMAAATYCPGCFQRFAALWAMALRRILCWLTLLSKWLLLVGGTATAKPARPLVAAAWAHTRDVRQSLSDVLDAALGADRHKAEELHISELKGQLKPLFDVLPKNDKGLLSHSTVRYAMHRHFVHHHGMYVKGFEACGEPWSSSSPTEMMEDQVPSYVQELFDQWLHDGFNLNELALFAAALEHFVHKEAQARLAGAFRLTRHEEGIKGSVSVQDFHVVADAYMALFLDGKSHDDLTAGEMSELLKGMSMDAVEWGETQKFVREVTEQIMEQEHPESGPSAEMVTFQVAAKIVDSLTNRFGKHQDKGCRKMANKLIGRDTAASGRVPLSVFYRAGEQFRESKEYLESLGALEKGGGGFLMASQDYVIIPNYITARPNCVHSSGMYSICCLDPCEGILRHIEDKVAAPTASPQRLAEIVANTESETVQAPRVLSASLTKRLDEMSAVHDGSIPLHARLFSQWLHHAFPRECPYPGKTVSRRPITADSWLGAQNMSNFVSDEELEALIEEEEVVHVKDLVDGDMEETLPWDPEEELVYHHQRPSLLHESASSFISPRWLAWSSAWRPQR